jgi:hypothetical protein
MLLEIKVGNTYQSNSGYLFKVLGLPKHGQDCSEGMVYYTALEPTFDSPAGSTWVISESVFLKRFKEVTNAGYPSTD